MRMTSAHLLLLVLCLACASTVHSLQNLYSISNVDEAIRYGQQLAELEQRYNSDDEAISAKAGAEVLQMANEYARHYDIKDFNPQKDDDLDTFASSLWDISDINLRAKETGWWAAITFFTGISDDDFEEKYLMREFKAPNLLNQPIRLKFPLNLGVNWDALNKVTSVKQQLGCGSCWAFAAIAALESRYLIKKGLNAGTANIDLSEQQILNCVNSGRTNTAGAAYSDNNCAGGYSDQVFDYVRKYNVTSEDVIPYVASVQACNQNPLVGSRPARALQQMGPNPGFYQVPSSNLTALKQAIQYTPVVFYLRVESSFKQYSGGVYSTACSGTKLNHAMMMYGYDDSPVVGSGKFFRFKNSWGEGWGEAGKGRIKMDDSSGGMNGGLCGCQKYAYYPNENSQFKPVAMVGRKK